MEDRTRAGILRFLIIITLLIKFAYTRMLLGKRKHDSNFVSICCGTANSFVADEAFCVSIPQPIVSFSQFFRKVTSRSEDVVSWCERFNAYNLCVSPNELGLLKSARDDIP